MLGNKDYTVPTVRKSSLRTKNTIEVRRYLESCNTMTEEENKDEIILWAIEISGNSSAIRSFLRVSGIPYKEVNAWGKTRTDEYISKFPTNLAPAIEHGSVCLSENAGRFSSNIVFSRSFSSSACCI